MIGLRWKIIVFQCLQYKAEFTSFCGVESPFIRFRGGDARKLATTGSFDWDVYTQIGRFSLLRKIAIDPCAIDYTVSGAIPRT